MEILAFLVLIPILRALIFLADWWFIRKACNQHNLYLKGAGENAGENEKEKSTNAANWITENMTEIKRRVEKAGVHEPVHSFMDFKGYGYVGQEKISALDNLLYLNEQILHSGIQTLRRTKGYYINQVKRSINPLYWVEVIFYLPKALVSASGIDVSSKLAETGLKIIQVIYWLIIIFAVLLNPDLLRILIKNVSGGHP